MIIYSLMRLYRLHMIISSHRIYSKHDVLRAVRTILPSY